MNAIQSSQDFVKALKSATDPPFQEGPCKVEIARQVWDHASFYVPSKAEVITEWILTKFLKDKGKDRFVHFTSEMGLEMYVATENQTLSLTFDIGRF
jgi:hypothetical protein